MSNDYAHAAAMGELIEAARPFTTRMLHRLTRELESIQEDEPTLLRHPPQEPLRLRG